MGDFCGFARLIGFAVVICVCFDVVVWLVGVGCYYWLRLVVIVVLRIWFVAGYGGCDGSVVNLIALVGCLVCLVACVCLWLAMGWLFYGVAWRSVLCVICLIGPLIVIFCWELLVLYLLVLCGLCSLMVLFINLFYSIWCCVLISVVLMQVLRLL